MTEPTSTGYVACSNEACPEYGLPKDDNGYPTAEIACGGCGGAVRPVPAP